MTKNTYVKIIASPELSRMKLGGLAGRRGLVVEDLSGEDRKNKGGLVLLEEAYMDEFVWFIPEKSVTYDSATMALDAKALRLTIDEYEEFRAEDAETIRRLGVKIRNLEAAARHEVEVKAPIDAAVRDTLIVRDTVPLLRQKVEMVTPHIHFSGLIEENRLKGDIKIPVTLNQAVWVEYKGWWFWKRVKAIRQTISSNNPYVEIRYSEYIKIDKK